MPCRCPLRTPRRALHVKRIIKGNYPDGLFVFSLSQLILPQLPDGSRPVRQFGRFLLSDGNAINIPADRRGQQTSRASNLPGCPFIEPDALLFWARERRAASLRDFCHLLLCLLGRKVRHWPKLFNGPIIYWPSLLCRIHVYAILTQAANTSVKIKYVRRKTFVFCFLALKIIQ